MSEIGDQCVGRWTDILMQIGIAGTFLKNKHGPCPMCGGKDRFRFNDREGRGTFYCNQCGGGDGFKLVMMHQRIDFVEAAKRIEPLVGAARRIKARKPVTSSLAELRRLWGRSKTAALDNTTGRYLARRCKLSTFPEALRHVESLQYWGGDGQQAYPAMLARVTDSSGASVQLYRTYLAHPDQKAPLDEPRRMMSGAVPPGSAIRLAEVRDSRLGIAEGIETAISASALHGLPCWAAIGTAGLAGWLPPEGVTHVVIFADHDSNFAGHAAAYTLAHKLKVRGIEAEVLVPPAGDWNDIHQGAMEGPDS